VRRGVSLEIGTTPTVLPPHNDGKRGNGLARTTLGITDKRKERRRRKREKGKKRPLEK
jgi:hypothetical protein